MNRPQVISRWNFFVATLIDQVFWGQQRHWKDPILKLTESVEKAQRNASRKAKRRGNGQSFGNSLEERIIEDASTIKDFEAILTHFSNNFGEA